MKLVVSDSSPLRALGQLGLLDLLPLLFDSILLPPGVLAELSVNVEGVQRIDFNRYRFLEVRAPVDLGSVASLCERVGAGEAEAIVLALESRADALLIDDGKGRSIAEGRGIKVLGVLGLLVQAKRAGHLALVEPLIVRLEQELTFRLSPRLRRRILDAAGE